MSRYFILETILKNTMQFITYLPLTPILALLGTVTGTIGCVLGILNYLRDRPKIVIGLIWDMEPWGHTNLDKNKLYGCITVANIGRRPIFISHAAIKLPGKNKYL